LAIIRRVPADPQLLAALTEAVQRQPEAIPLRLHLAGLLLENGAEQQALGHYEEVLSREPENMDALLGATRASDAIGDATGAALYRTRMNAARPPEPVAAQGPGQERSDQDGGVSPASGHAWWDVEVSSVRMADVGGMENVKRRLQVSFLGPMRNPDLRAAYGKSLRGGLLLFGPPGCGKTYIARALAGELDARFISVGLADILDMWLGESEKRVKELFRAAREHSPCVVFLDELDALGQKRTHLTHHVAQRGVVNQLLSELDGASGGNEGVYVLAATNQPWDVDSALLRPGRLDRMVLVLPPDRDARLAILTSKLVGRPVETVDLKGIADKTDGYSGADLTFLCDAATELAMEEAIKSGSLKRIGQQHFQRALKEIHPSTREWFETARNFALFSNQAGVYDDLIKYMKEAKLM
jgi:AAA+ superfamily predicted ATPase